MAVNEHFSIALMCYFGWLGTMTQHFLYTQSLVNMSLVCKYWLWIWFMCMARKKERKNPLHVMQIIGYGKNKKNGYMF